MLWIIGFTSLFFLLLWLETRRCARVRLTELRVRVDCPDLGDSGLTLLHISDLHLTTKRMDRLEDIERAARRDWDLVLLTGDYVEETAALFPLAETLVRLRARYGVYAVLGNHDHYHYRADNPWRWFKVLVGSLTHQRCESLGDTLDTGVLIRIMEGAGVRALVNEQVEIDLDGRVKLQLFGIDDPSSNRDDPGSLYHLMSDAALRLVLIHSPRHLARLAPLKPHLVLCGHTHGGQVALPLIGALSTGSDAPRRAASGMVTQDGLKVHISPGAGAGTVFPWRILSPAGITSIRLDSTAGTTAAE